MRKSTIFFMFIIFIFTTGCVQVHVNSVQERGRNIDLYVTVQDFFGKSVNGLRRYNFTFQEDGKTIGSEVLADVAQKNTLITMLVLDVSHSIKHSNALDAIRKAAIQFVQDLPTGAPVGVIRFAERVELVQEITPVRSEVLEKLQNLDFFEAKDRDDASVWFTNIYGAVDEAIEVVNQYKRKENKLSRNAPAIVLFTDGNDNVNPENNLDLTCGNLKRNKIVLYAAGLGREVKPKVLKAISETGDFRLAEREDELKSMFEEISTELGNIYLLNYKTPKKPSSQSHTLKIKVKCELGMGSTSTYFRVSETAKERYRRSVGYTQSNSDSGRFLRTKCGSIVDTSTNLEWFVGEDEDINWVNAYTWTRYIKSCGGGWRLPRIKEIKTLFLASSNQRSIDPLFNITKWWVWSYEQLKGEAKYFSFYDGEENWERKTIMDGYRVLAVRKYMKPVENF